MRHERMLFVLVALLGIWGVATTSAPLWRVRTTTQLAAVRDTCRALPAHAMVVWLGPARTQLIEPTRQLCQVPTAGYGRTFSNAQQPSRKTLAAVARSATRQGKIAVVGLYSTSRHLLPTASGLTLAHSSVTRSLEQTLDHAPQKIMTGRLEIYLGRVLPDGTVATLPVVPSRPE